MRIKPDTARRSRRPATQDQPPSEEPNVIAKKTLAAIEAAINADGGAAFRQLQAKTLPMCADAYAGEEDENRTHLGASLMGRRCARELFYAFRWVGNARPVEARMRRLWNRGHLEEGRMVAMLMMIGVQVYQHDENNNQFRISAHDGHFGGSLDAVLVNCPDIPDQPILGEFKTHNEKSFAKLVHDGVHEAKYEHFIQMQLYMRKMGLAVALYVAVCKNTDDLYMEIIYLNPEYADQYLQRGDDLVWRESAPKKINTSAGFFKCRFCDDRPVCHLGAAPDINCRTCQFSSPQKGAAWHCSKHNIPLSKEKQLVGCPDWYENDGLRA